MTEKLYKPLTPGAMHPDPLSAAIGLELVGKHTESVRELIGAWRWPVVFKHRASILPLVSQGYVIDWGGAAGPIGYGSVVVDYFDPVFRSLTDICGKADVIFSAHTLEHVTDLELAVLMIHHKIRPGGALVVVVPSSNHLNLRAENWPFHGQTFCLGDEGYTRLDHLWESAGFKTALVDDEADCLLYIGVKPV